VEWRRRLLRQDYWKDPLSKSEYYRLGDYGRGVWRASQDLRWAKDQEGVRKALLGLFGAQRRYAQGRWQDLSPSPRWRGHTSEYYELRRYMREAEGLERALKREKGLTPQQAQGALRRAIEAEGRLLRARMEDIRRRDRYYWRNEEYRKLEECARNLEREAGRLGW